jgi:hypothetical protein
MSLRDLYSPAAPEIFVPFFQHPEGGRDMALLLRTNTEPATLTDEVRQQVLSRNDRRSIWTNPALHAVTKTRCSVREVGPGHDFDSHLPGTGSRISSVGLHGARLPVKDRVVIVVIGPCGDYVHRLGSRRWPCRVFPYAFNPAPAHNDRGIRQNIGRDAVNQVCVR